MDEKIQETNFWQEDTQKADMQQEEAPQQNAYVAPADEKNDVEDNKLMAILSYLFPIVPLVVHFTKKDGPKSPFMTFHLNQGVILWIANIALSVLTSLLKHVDGIRLVIGVIGGLGSLAIFIFAIMGLVSAVKGEQKSLPLIGGIKIIK